MTFLNKNSKVSNYEDGTRTGLSNLSYEEQAKQPTFKSQGEVKESELPQVSSPGASFEESEYWIMPPSGIDWGFDSRALYPPDPNSPWNIIFQAWSNDCYDKGADTDIEIRGTYPITGVVVMQPGNIGIGGGGNRYTITAPEEGPGYAPVDVYMKTQNGAKGISRAVIRACADACVPDPAMAWDAVTSSETVARGGSSKVAITGANGPFSWTVSGTGFTMDEAVTVGLENFLIAGGTACGCATITVTGCDSVSVTGIVRCYTNGHWSAYGGSGCPFPSEMPIDSWSWSAPYYIVEATKGKYKVEMTIGYGGASNLANCEAAYGSDAWCYQFIPKADLEPGHCVDIAPVGDISTDCGLCVCCLDGAGGYTRWRAVSWSRYEWTCV